MLVRRDDDTVDTPIEALVCGDAAREIGATM